MSIKRAGFTLVEVLVASTIAVFIAMVAAAALRTMTASSDAVDRNIDAAAEVRFAANMIARDLQNFYRTDDVEDTKLIGMLEPLNEDLSASNLIFYTISRIKARADQPEGDIYEVEYGLLQDEEKSRLMRRVWPNPSEELEPGGMLTVIAEDIELFEVEYFDGEESVYEWPEEMQSLPELMTVTLAAKSTGLGIGPTESFIVALAGSEGGDIAALGGTGSLASTGTTE
ncbi:MAG: type II secretion system protein GspJ [Planctomycetota bacterium]|jgi:type II secretion system protein J